MLFHGQTTKVNEWHGLSGVIPTCHGTSLNFGLDIYLRMGTQSRLHFLPFMLYLFCITIYNDLTSHPKTCLTLYISNFLHLVPYCSSIIIDSCLYVATPRNCLNVIALYSKSYQAFTISQNFWLDYFLIQMMTYRDIRERICVAGGDASMVESPTEPKWSPEGTNIFLYAQDIF